MIADYWASADSPSREALVTALRRHHIASVLELGCCSVLELGCHCGPVLKRLRSAFGSKFFYSGVDINAGAIEAARSFHVDDQRAQWICRDGLEFLHALEEPCDVVVTSSTLMHMPPDQISDWLREIRRVVRLAVVCHEPVGHGEFVDGRGWSHAYPDWVITC